MEGVERGVLVAEAGVERTGGPIGVRGDVGDGDLVERAIFEELLDRPQEEVEGDAAPPLTGRAVPLVAFRAVSDSVGAEAADGAVIGVEQLADTSASLWSTMRMHP